MSGVFWLRTRQRPRVNLALQGGGAHGAFTWGVLDRILDEETIDIGWVSATSAGAINAVAMAAGLADNGRAGAKAHLRDMWDAIYKAGVPDFLRLNPFLYGLTRSMAVSQMATLWSPYDFNPLGFDPLRKLVTENIDFEAVRAYEGVELLIAATEVATGRPRLFRRHELTPDAVLASACLPTLHHAVEIEGQAYWDGGFSANPDIVTLACESPVADTIIVEVNPIVMPGLPTGAREIAARVNTLTFNAPLRRDIEIVLAARELSRGGIRRKSRLSTLAGHRFHMIEAGRHTSALSADSKMKPDRALFTRLHQAGRDETDAWLERHRGSIGQRETVDFAARFLAGAEARTTPIAPSPKPPVKPHAAKAAEVNGAGKKPV